MIIMNKIKEILKKLKINKTGNYENHLMAYGDMITDIQESLDLDNTGVVLSTNLADYDVTLAGILHEVFIFNDQTNGVKSGYSVNNPIVFTTKFELV